LGKKPAFLAIAAAAIAGWLLYVHPRVIGGAFERTDVVELATFLLIGVGAALLTDRLRAARQKAESIAVYNRELFEKYQYNLEAANAGTFEWNIATDEVVWSANMESLHGHAPGTFDGTVEGVFNLIHPEDRDLVRTEVARAVAGDAQYHVECRHLRSDGTVGWMEGKGRLLRDERTGKAVRMIGVCIDATERKRHERALQRLAAIVDSSDDAILSADLEGKILTWNAAAERMYGYSAGEVVGNEITLLFAPSCASKKAEILNRLTHGDRIEQFEAHCIHKSGRAIWASLTISPIGENNGAPMTVSFIARDITEKKQIEEQLRQTAKLESLGILAGGIAHDFNNLLVGILGNASLVRDATPAGSRTRTMLDDVVSASERAANLTRQLLAYSGKGKFIIEPLSLSDLTRDMVSLIQSSIPRTVRLQLDLASDLPPVTADVAQMQQLIMNLVINGAEAIGERAGAVTVTTRLEKVNGQPVNALHSTDELPAGSYVSLEVRDTGSGMDAATLSKIFDPFFTTKFTGRGLGLSATLGIVRGHKGAITVDSSPGGGSAFRVFLPVGAELTVSSEPSGEAEDLTGSGAVLVVDDEEVVRRAAVGALEECGYTVITANNGQMAVDLFRKFSEQISLVVLDLSMPVMGGEDCVGLMRSINPNTPMILSSGFSEADAIDRFNAHSFAGFLQKPYTARRLAEMAKSAVTSRVQTSGGSA